MVSTVTSTTVTTVTLFGISALLGSRGHAFIEDYKFDITPPTDDRPYFFNFFKWRTLPEVLSLRERGGAGLLEWGYLVLLATLVQALVAGSVLILLPLFASRRAWPGGAGGALGGYFFLLGLAFLFVEMAFIQKFILFLSHPLYSVAAVLAGFLVFAGLGMASPYILLGANPNWLSFLPKPGQWMISFEKTMGFFLLVIILIFLYSITGGKGPKLLTFNPLFNPFLR